MGKQGVVSVVALFLFIAVPAFSTNESIEVLATEGVTANADASHINEAAAAHIHWDFITCVCDAHECLHEAEHHGYEHYKVKHDHNRCGHDDVACYGGHH